MIRRHLKLDIANMLRLVLMSNILSSAVAFLFLWIFLIHLSYP